MPTSKLLIKSLNFRARLKNVDRSSATYHSVTVDDFTVVITEFKPKAKKEKKEKISSPNGSSDNNDKNNGEHNNHGGPGGGGEGPSPPSQPPQQPRNGADAAKDVKKEPGDATRPHSNGSNAKDLDAKDGLSGAGSTHLSVQNGVDGGGAVDGAKPKVEPLPLTDTSRSS